MPRSFLSLWSTLFLLSLVALCLGYLIAAALAWLYIG